MLTVRSSLQYDESQWPFLIVTFPTVPMSESVFRGNLLRMDAYAERGGPFGFVLDTRGAPDPDAERRRTIAEYWDSCLKRYGDAFIGAAVAMSSPTGRAVFKAILWLRNQPLLLIPVATPKEGLDKLRAAAKERRKLAG